MLCRHHHRPVRSLGLAHQLERGLVRLCAGVGEEHPAVGAQQSDQSLGQLDLPLVQEQVRGVRERRDLPGDRLDDRRMRVPERADRDAADQVQVAVAVNIDDVQPLPRASATGGTP